MLVVIPEYDAHGYITVVVLDDDGDVITDRTVKGWSAARDEAEDLAVEYGCDILKG